MTTLPPTALQHAMAFLRRVLRDGPRPTRDVDVLAREEGISRRTLRRARARLGVRTWPLGFGGVHVLALPEPGPDVGPQVARSVPAEDPEQDRADPPKVQTLDDPTSRPPYLYVARPDAAAPESLTPERPGIRRVRIRRVERRQPSN